MVLRNDFFAICLLDEPVIVAVDDDFWRDFNLRALLVPIIDEVLLVKCRQLGFILALGKLSVATLVFCILPIVVMGDSISVFRLERLLRRIELGVAGCLSRLFFGNLRVTLLLQCLCYE